MPNGRVMRIDDDRRCAYVVRRGRSYEAPLSEVETAARVPGARVRYKLRRAGGVEQAEQVQLRTGTRTGKRQRRFGDLTGARQPGTNVRTSGQKAYGIDVATQPMRVVNAWLEAIAARDIDGATSLYLPGAVLHLPDESVSDRRRIRAQLEACQWVGVDRELIELHGTDRYLKAEWPNAGEPEVGYFFIEQGQIVEQWLGTEPELDADDTPDVAFDVVTKGDVDGNDRAYAEKRLQHLLATVGYETPFARMKLSRAANPADETPARAEGTLDTAGTVIRAHAAAPTITEAVDLVTSRLRNKLERRHDRERHQARGSAPGEGEWRHGFMPSAPLDHFDRSVDDREIVRHKSFAPEEMTTVEAAWDLSLLDYDFLLYVEVSTGIDCLVERSEHDGAVLHTLEPERVGEMSGSDEFDVSQEVAPTLKPSEAIQLMDGSGQPFLFFRNAISSRGNVVYRRYDGHYGLITPPVDE